MRIKKIYQGELPENKIVNEKLDSQTDTYSCDYINNLSFEGGNGVDELPIDSIIEYEGETVPEGWELVEGSESGERNYIQCELTDRLNVPDTNYVLVPFNNNLIMGGAFTYDETTNEVVIDPKSNIDKVKIHFHSVMAAGGEKPVTCFEVLVYRNDEIALIANESMELGSSRTAVSVDRVVDCTPGDRFRVEIKSYDNIFILLNTYGRTVFSLEDMTNVTVNNVTVEGTIEAKELSFAQMRTNVNSGVTLSDTKTILSAWGDNNIQVGKFRCEPANNRIVIPAGSAEYVEIYGSIAGSGYVSVDVQLRDPDGTLIDEISNILQFSGNKYFSSFIGSKIVKIPDTSKEYYLRLNVGGYRESFSLNTGFAKDATCIGVREVSTNETVISTGTIEAKENNYIQCGLSQNIEGVDYLGKVIDFDQIISNGSLFYMSSNSTVKVKDNVESGRAKIHIHAGAQTYNDKPIGNVYFMVWQNGVSIGAININLHAALSRNQSSIDIITDYAAGDTFYLSCGTSENEATVLGSYNRTMMSIEEISDTVIVNNITEGTNVADIGTILYESTEGSNQNLTLSEAISNFEYVDITYGIATHKFTKRIPGDTPLFTLDRWVVVDGLVYTRMTTYNVTDNIISVNQFALKYDSDKQVITEAADASPLAIFKVIGYNQKPVEITVEKQSMITLSLPSNFSYTSDTRYAQDVIPLELSNIQGDRLLCVDNGVKIGPGISKVLVNAQLALDAQKSGSLYGLVVTKYKASGGSVGYRSLWTAGNDKYYTINYSNRLIDVEEGDVLKMEFYIDAVGPSLTIRNNETFLTVEETSSEVTNIISNVTRNVTQNITTNGMSLIYSDEEQLIGTWFDKPLYQKTIDFGDFPTAGQGKTVAHNVANVDKIWVDRGNSYFVDSSKGYYDVSDYDWHTHVNATNIIMYTEYSRPNSSVYITIRYTKTTD